MDLRHAHLLANNLMVKHGLISKGWSFSFDNAKRRFGVCRYRTKRISLSKHLVELNSEARVTNTILHEIAHALVGPGCGHGAIWKQVAINIGCNGERCYSSHDTVTPQPNYQAVCGTCGKTHKRHRLPTKKYSCGYCTRKYDERYLLKFVKN